MTRTMTVTCTTVDCPMGGLSLDMEQDPTMSTYCGGCGAVLYQGVEPDVNPTEEV